MKRHKIVFAPLNNCRARVWGSLISSNYEKASKVRKFSFRMKYWYQFENEVKGQLINFRWMDYEESEDVWLK